MVPSECPFLYFHQLYQDIMAVVAKLGNPDLFVAFTCNPDWPEMRADLLGRQSPADRPVLCARIFHMKVRARGVLAVLLGACLERHIMI